MDKIKFHFLPGSNTWGPLINTRCCSALSSEPPNHWNQCTALVLSITHVNLKRFDWKKTCQNDKYSCHSEKICVLSTTHGEIRQNLSWKETYMAFGKATAILFEALFEQYSGNSFREIAGLFRMAPRGHVQTLTPRTWERRRASCRYVRRGKCISMKMRVLETERTSSPNVNITAYIQPRGASRSNDTFQRLCGTLWS